MLVQFDYQEVTSPSLRITAARRLGMDDTKLLNVSVEIYSNSCRLSCNCRILKGRRWAKFLLRFLQIFSIGKISELLVTTKQGHVSYVAMLLSSSPYEALRYLVGKEIVFCQTIAALMNVDSLQDHVYSLEPL
ncbi:hypothetical protein AVEN_198125-1 [Araneus ventricosus]|uniref:Uncharacterized protein n=1 Tax=Araneus ventricosus TaxID=182803 RepID=A0A4Y2U6Q2_ARAVE|nr:hypothetical protein AVEN_46704-1 [Araneus ventricosus]GBO07789.1 hypothetical protein AVEN_198125-1 [Araneus ventricosus]